MSYTLDTEIQSATVYLDSTNCISRSPTFKYSLATSITSPTACRMLLSVIAVSLPNVINNINENNNQLSMIISSNATTSARYTFIFPIGIYSAWTFRDYLNSQFVLGGHNISCVYDYKSFKFSFSAPYDCLIISDGNHITTCSHLIGVGKTDSNTYIYPIYADFPFYTIKLPSTVNFNASPYMFLKISNIYLSNINSFGNINDTLIRIPINCNYGEMIQYRPVETIKFLIQVNSINSFDLRLEDVYNDALSLPSGAELQVVLKIDYIFPPQQLSYGVGTISHYFKANPITDTEMVEDETL
jgi:hypothetical protein